MTSVIVCIDFIHEIVHPTGKLAAKGYASFAESHSSLGNLAARQTAIRSGGGRVIHVHLAYAQDYSDHPTRSPLLGGARAGGILKLGTQSSTIHSAVAPQDGDVVLQKKRISAFHGTSLEITLRSMGVSEITIAGVATDLAVQSAARDAHDRDFLVRIAADSCIAASDEDHAAALKN
ncbi:MAG: cysteine hydrolase family protein, partial [Methyloceanibacter sp.]